MWLRVTGAMLLASINIIFTYAADRFTLRQRIQDLAEFKRSIVMSRNSNGDFNNVYSRTSSEIAQSVEDSLFRKLILGKI